jgi:uncharacterized membrane protein YesL
MKFKLFDLNRDGLGVEKNEDTTPNVGYFFKSLWRKFPKLISINLLMILQNLPLLGAILTYIWAYKTPTFTNTSYPVLYGIARFSESPADELVASLSGIQLRIPLVERVILPILLLLLVYILLFGICNVAFSYYMREMIRGNPVFLFSDFKYAVKKNFKQGFLMGLIDVLILGVLAFDFANMPSNSIIYFLILGVAIIYFMMRFYLYLMLITFDMKIGKMFKNAFILVILGVKRNLLAILWLIVMLALNFAIFVLYMPLGIALPILYFFSFSTFTTAYAAYPVIKKYMIDPYETKSDDEISGEGESL